MRGKHMIRQHRDARSRSIHLQQVAYDGPRRWGMVRLATLMFFCGRHVGVGGVLRTWLPLCLLAAALVVGVSVGLS